MQIGKKYIIILDAVDRALTYTAEILSEEDFFFEIKDKEGHQIFISKDRIISFREVGS